jgi:multiple sugar transport system substrate-binding protein
MKHGSHLTRRTFLAGLAGTAATAILAACGGSGATDTPKAAATTAATAASGAATTAPTTAAAAATAVATTASGASSATTGGATAAVTTGTGAASAATPVKLKAAKITVAQFGSVESAQATQKILDNFKKVQPDITVQVNAVSAPDWDGFAAKLLTQIAAGDVPDLITVATEGLQLFAGKGLAAPMDDYVKRDKEQLKEFFADVHPTLIEAMMYNGSLYALPDNFNAANIFYSKGAFQKHNVPEPSPTWTKDDFANAMPKLITQSGGRTTEYSYFWTNRMWGGALPWMFINGSNILTEEKFPGGDWLWSTFYANDPSAKGRQGGIKWANAKANDPANVEAVQFLADLTQKIKAAPSPAEADSSNSQIITTFANKQLATYVGGGFLVRSLDQAGVKADEYGVTFMPKWKTQRHQFGTAGYVISAKSPNKDAAWELAKWRISKEVMTSNYKDSASVRTRRSLNQALFEGTYGFKGYQVFYDTLDKYPDTGPIPQPPQANEVTQIFTKYVGLAVSGDQPVQTAMDNMQKDLAAALAKQP